MLCFDPKNFGHAVQQHGAEYLSALAVAAAAESTAMEGSAVKGTMRNVVTVKKAEPKREPYRNNVGEIRV